MITANITQNIKDAVNGLATYGGTITAELERLFWSANNRYPYSEIAGPDIAIETESRLKDMCSLQYEIRYFVNVNDENETVGGEITYLTRNVHADIIRALMVDVSRGGYAQKTELVRWGPSFEVFEDITWYNIYVLIEVKARIDATDFDLLSG